MMWLILNKENYKNNITPIYYNMCVKILLIFQFQLIFIQFNSGKGKLEKNLFLL